MKSEKKLHLISILSGVVIVFVAFWAFGLGNSLFDSMSIQKTPDAWYGDSDTTPLTKKVSALPTNNEQPVQEPNIPENTQTTTPQPIQSTTKQDEPDQPEVKTSNLEDRIFVFSGEGQIFQTPAYKLPAQLDLTLKPKPDSDLKEFLITRGKIIIENDGISFSAGTVIFSENQTIISLPEDGIQPTGELVGNASQMPQENSDNNITITFDEQEIFLSDADGLPYYLDMTGSFSVR